MVVVSSFSFVSSAYNLEPEEVEAVRAGPTEDGENAVVDDDAHRMERMAVLAFMLTAVRYRIER